jgi:hypothetical protein
MKINSSQGGPVPGLGRSNAAAPARVSDGTSNGPGKPSLGWDRVQLSNLSANLAATLSDSVRPFYKAVGPKQRGIDRRVSRGRRHRGRWHHSAQPASSGEETTLKWATHAEHNRGVAAAQVCQGKHSKFRLKSMRPSVAALESGASIWRFRCSAWSGSNLFCAREAHGLWLSSKPWVLKSPACGAICNRSTHC